LLYLNNILKMAMIKVGTLMSIGAPVLRKEILANSITSTVNDSLKLVSGFAALGTTGVAVFGHLTNHKSKNDVGLLTTGVAGAEMGSYVGTYLTASNNQTVGFVEAECDISKHSMYSAEVDATIGTTTGSNLSGYKMDLVDEDTLDESTAATTTAQYRGWGVDPENSANAIVNIFESDVYGV
jgi:hypothetical protein